jgi:hypothetical protein
VFVVASILLIKTVRCSIPHCILCPVISVNVRLHDGMCVVERNITGGRAVTQLVKAMH